MRQRAQGPRELTAHPVSGILPIRGAGRPCPSFRNCAGDRFSGRPRGTAASPGLRSRSPIPYSRTSGCRSGRSGRSSSQRARPAAGAGPRLVVRPERGRACDARTSAAPARPGPAVAAAPVWRDSVASGSRWPSASGSPSAPSRRGNGSCARASTNGPGLAVLPFANLSPDPANAYFADGLHEEILATFARTRGLRVISRTSVQEYRDPQRNLREIAEALGVSLILEGSVRREGDDLRLTLQLIDGRTDELIWAETYDRKFRDVTAAAAHGSRAGRRRHRRQELSPDEQALDEAGRADQPGGVRALPAGTRAESRQLERAGGTGAGRHAADGCHRDGPGLRAGPRDACARRPLADRQ